MKSSPRAGAAAKCTRLQHAMREPLQYSALWHFARATTCCTPRCKSLVRTTMQNIMCTACRHKCTTQCDNKNLMWATSRNKQRCLQGDQRTGNGAKTVHMIIASLTFVALGAPCFRASTDTRDQPSLPSLHASPRIMLHGKAPTRNAHGVAKCVAP